MNAMPPIPSATARQSFPIEGMTCASCVRRVEKAIAAVPGAVTATVNLATESADVTFDGPANFNGVIAAIRDAGYDVPVERIEVDIEGMTCASCVGRVEKAIAAVPGVRSASVNLATERATVELLAGSTPRAAIDAAVHAQDSHRTVRAWRAADGICDGSRPDSAVGR